MNREFLVQMFEYREGNLYWKISKSRRVKVGDKVGSLNNKGYLQVQIDGKKFSVHRLVWILHHGDIPDDMTIDHINMDTLDNSIENLRLLSLQDNCKARFVKKRINNKSGYTGVIWLESKKRWKAYINVDGKSKHLGMFLELKEAISARKDAEILYGYSLITNEG